MCFKDKLNSTIKEGIKMKRVIIIGAGIIGTACAYHLSKKDIAVTVIDANSKGRATHAAAGIICPWLTKRRNKAWYKLAKNGAAYYETLINNLAIDGFRETGYKKVGAIHLHEDIKKLEELKQIAIARREDAPEIGNILILQNKEVLEKSPVIKDNYAGLFIEGAARVDGRLLKESMLQAAIQNGAEFVEGKATFVQDDKKEIKVAINESILEADHIIATNGVWMKELFTSLHIDLPIQAQKGEIIHLQIEDMDTSSFPVIMPPNNQYMLSFDEGKIVIGASHHHVKQLETSISVEGAHYILDQALQMAPDLANSSIEEIRVGFRPFTFNHLPVFGPVPEQPQLLIANGLGASGLTTGPYIGKQLAQFVVNEATDIPIDPYCVKQIIK